MKLAKVAVEYYVNATGNQWSKFYDDLDVAMSGDINQQSGDVWLVHMLMNALISKGITVNDVKVGKDVVKSAFDEGGRKLQGEFFTPILWAEELHRYMDKYIPNWRTDYNVWEGSCYSMDTEVFTKRGWLKYDELRYDDLIYTFNYDKMIGEWCGFHDRFKKPYKGRMVAFAGKSFDLLVTPDHSMCAKYAPQRRVESRDDYERLSADELMHKYDNKSERFDSWAMRVGVKQGFWGKPKAGMPSDKAFWKLAGFMLLRGESTSASRMVVGITSEKVRLMIEGLLQSLDVTYYRTDWGETDRLCIKDRVFVSHINDLLLNKDGSKHVPFEYFDDVRAEAFFEGMVCRLESAATFDRFKEDCRNSYQLYAPDARLCTELEQFAIQMGYQVTHVKAHKSCFSLYLSGRCCVHMRSGHIHEVPYDGFVWDLTTNNDNHVFLVRRNGKQCFSGNCGSGNLIRTAKITPEHLFASSLQDDDITLIKNTEELAGCHAFQLDFLSNCDDDWNTQFVDNLPEELQRVIRNDEPLIFLMNPPYKNGQANATEVGRHMNGANHFFNNVDFAKPAYDLFYQFCFQVMNVVARFNLTNCYYAFFGPLTFFTGAGANILLKEFERTFEFIDGFCISAQEFSDTSDSIIWGISSCIWKSRGGYMPQGDINYHKDVLLDKKFIAPDGSIGCEGKVLYEAPREKLSAWVEPKDTAGSIEAPLMTSHLTFKGSEVFEKIAPKSGKLATNALGTLMVGNTLTRSADQSAVLSMPTTIAYVSITEENFWRCVASYTFRRVFDASWAITKKEISAPNTGVEGYDLWLRNALIVFLFEYKSMMSSLRNVRWGGYTDYCIVNKLFFLSEEEVRANCHDEVILRDLEEHPLQNQFMLRMIKESEPYWAPEVKQLYDWCKNYTLFSYDRRKTVNYKGSLECADAGFQQIRSGLWDAEKLDPDLSKLLVQARDYMRREVMKFGFVSEVIKEDL